jgi:glycosyltransferase involved in cell wall biosynthesis
MAELRIAHVIAGLDTGGAEMMLLKLIEQSQGRVTHTVISLTGMGTLGERILAAGGRVTALNLRGPFQMLFALQRLARVLNQSRPDLVQGWMYHGNIAASLTGHRWPVVWAIRCTIGTFKEKLLTRFLVRVGALLSSQPRAIFYNSAAARVQHEAIGYARHGLVLPNGFDTDRFMPDAKTRAAFRGRIGASPDRPLAGYIGRLHPIKDLPTFFAAMAQAARARPDLAVIAIGKDLPRAAEILPETRPDIEFLGDRLTLLAEQADVRGWYQAFDVSILSSFAEGFPNVLGEAMSSGTPCVSTDAGESRAIIADTGRVVPVKDVAAMTGALLEIVNMAPDERAALGKRARARIDAHYSIQAVTAQHEDAWARLAGRV